jgi:hypothetical protein
MAVPCQRSSALVDSMVQPGTTNIGSMPGRRWLCDLKQETSEVLRMCCRTFRCRASTKDKDRAREGYCGLRRHRFFSDVYALHDTRDRKPIQRDRCEGCQSKRCQTARGRHRNCGPHGNLGTGRHLLGKICTSVPAPESGLAVWGQDSR